VVVFIIAGFIFGEIMRKKTLIESTVDAANVILIVDSINKAGSISIVGLVIAETVVIEIPKVANPVVGTDANWTPLVYGGVAYVLDADNNRRSIPYRGTYRLAKDASPGNAFAVEFD